MHFQLRLLFALGAAFILVAPLSVAPGIPFAEEAKYFRLLITMLIVAIGIVSGSRLKLGRASWALTLFALLFSASGGWSDSPGWGLFNKGMFGLSCFSGTVIACSMHTPAELRSGLRFLGMVSGAAALVTFVLYLKTPNQAGSLNRMALFGMNPNLMGHAAVSLSILCMYVGIEDRRRLWQAAMFGACCLLGLIIIATGCRGAALTLMVGTACLVAPYTRRPGVLVGVLLGMALVGILGFEVMDIGGNDRLISEMSKDNRGAIWRYGMKQFYKAPLIGRGWLHIGNHSMTVLSVYVQTLAETGVVGAATLITAIAIVVQTWLQGLSRLRRMRLPTGLCFLALALLLVEMVHGLTETSPFIGTNMASMVLGLGVGLTDRAVSLGGVPRWQSRQMAAATANPAARRRPSVQEVLDAMRPRSEQAPLNRSS